MSIKNLQIVQIDINKLNPADYNPRQATEKEYQDLKKSIERFGVVDPIIINSSENRKNTVIGGHFRLRVLKDMKYKKVPCVYVNISDIEKEKELNIRLNKNQGEFDLDMLANFDEELLKDVGFESKELDRIFQLDARPEDDDVPEVKESICKKSDIWQLGRHRVMCGDSTKREDVEKLMDGKKADMVFTDPPYAVNYGHKQENLKKNCKAYHWSRSRFGMEGDNLTVKETAEKIWCPAFRNLYEFAQDWCSFYLTMCQGGDQMMMMMMMMSEKWNIKHELIWVKSSPVFSMGRLDYDYKHEPILFGWKKSHKFYGNGQFKKSIWEIPKPSKSDLHPTMKPIVLIENALLNSSQRDEICIDLFLGSGSTLIACEKTNRICYGMEIDEHYCDVIIKRWEDYSKQKAIKMENLNV